jgi:hypothetical protein
MSETTLLVPDAKAPDPAADRRTLVDTGLCLEAHPAITLELYGSLRSKAGREFVPMRADTIGTAVAVLKRVCPQVARLLPEGAALAENFRFAINGHSVTTDLSAGLSEGDRLILFSASVGG